MSETKKRLLLSKWRGVADRAEIEWRMERLSRDVDQLNDLVGKLASQDEKIETLSADLAEAKEEIRSLEDDRDEYAERLERTLHDVKYWMLEPLAHHQPMRDPRKMLRQVEDVLG
jgi:chromosome segregation ATPase